MKLSYRGVSYEKDSSILDIIEGDIGGKYRGNDWKYHYPRHIPQQQPKLYRQYRGVSYSTRPLTSGESPPMADTSTTATSCAVSLKYPRKIVTNYASQTHLDNIRRNLERRLQVAKAKGDESLIELLEQESQQLTLN